VPKLEDADSEADTIEQRQWIRSATAQVDAAMQVVAKNIKQAFEAKKKNHTTRSSSKPRQEVADNGNNDGAGHE